MTTPPPWEQTITPPQVPGKVRNLKCCCCAEPAGRFAQHWNRDTGYGLCVACARRFRDDPSMSRGEVYRLYGIAGVNYEDPGPPADIVARAIVVEMQTPVGRIAAYSMIDGPAVGCSYIAHDYHDASALIGREVRATFQLGDRFARLAPEPATTQPDGATR